MSKKIADTPLMRQYVTIKKQYPDAVLLFRVGDFYETFSDDAIVASEILESPHATRQRGCTICGVGRFSAPCTRHDLPKLVRRQTRGYLRSTGRPQKAKSSLNGVLRNW